MRLHDLRHGAATFAGGVVPSAETVRKRLGHGDLRMTTRYMAHRFDEAELAAADAVAVAIYGPEEESVSNG